MTMLKIGDVTVGKVIELDRSATPVGFMLPDATPERIAAQREVLVRGIPTYIDFASFVIGELKQVGVEGTLKQVDTVQWYGLLTRKDYQIGANISGFGLDDPDANFYENFSCTSLRNYTGYCNEQVMKLIDQQSQELDQKKRLVVVQQVLKKLEEDAARPMMGWRLDYHAQWPYVKNLVPHHYLYTYGRMQDVWLDK